MHIRIPAVFVVLVLVLLVPFSSCQKGESHDATFGPDDNPANTGGIGGDDDNDTSDDDTSDDDTSDDDISDDDTSEEEINLLVIYNHYQVIVDDYAELLGYHDIQVTGLAESDVIEADYTNVDVILVESDTNWYSQEAAETIRATGLPLIGVFWGGGYLFDRLDLIIGFSGGDTDNAARMMKVRSADHLVFKEPFDLEVDEYSIITLYFSSVRLHYHDVQILPPTVVLLGERYLDVDWSAITLENGNRIFWGYEMEPNYLTDDGIHFLVNCIDYLATKK